MVPAAANLEEKLSLHWHCTILFSTLHPFDTLEVQGNNQWHRIQQAQMLGNAGQTQIILFLTIGNDPHHWKESNHLQIYL